MKLFYCTAPANERHVLDALYLTAEVVTELILRYEKKILGEGRVAYGEETHFASINAQFVQQMIEKNR